MFRLSGYSENVEPEDIEISRAHLQLIAGSVI